jgi:hypothetical protein
VPNQSEELNPFTTIQHLTLNCDAANLLLSRAAAPLSPSHRPLSPAALPPALSLNPSVIMQKLQLDSTLGAHTGRSIALCSATQAWTANSVEFVLTHSAASVSSVVFFADKVISGEDYILTISLR